MERSPYALKGADGSRREPKRGNEQKVVRKKGQEHEGECRAAQRRETSVAPIGRPFVPEVVLSRVRRNLSASGTDCAGEDDNEMSGQQGVGLAVVRGSGGLRQRASLPATGGECVSNPRPGRVTEKVLFCSRDRVSRSRVQFRRGTCQAWPGARTQGTTQPVA